MRLVACCAAALVAGLVPTPSGKGPRFHPPAHGPTASFACRAVPLDRGPRVHVELFARRRVAIVPAGVGVRGARLRLGRVVAARCRGPLWTLEPTGVVRFGQGARLGDLFRVWGEPLAPRRLLSFRGDVTLYVNGVRRRGDPRTLRLRDREEVVLEVGGYVPPHRSFLFPPH